MFVKSQLLKLSLYIQPPHSNILLYCNYKNIISRRMRWAGHVARMERRGVYRVLVGKPEGKNHLEDSSVDGRILRWIFRKWDVGVWIESSWHL